MKKKFALLLVIALAIILSGCSARGQINNWPGLSAADGYIYLANGQVHAIDEKAHTLAWAFPAKQDPNLLIFTPPVFTEDGTIIVGGAAKDNRLFSLDAKSGQEIWTFDQAERGWVAPPLVRDGIIYAPNSDGRLYVLDLDGQLLWTFDAGSPLWAQPVANEDTLFLTSLNHRLFALTLADGTLRWEAPLPAASTHAPTIDTTNNRLYIGGLTDQIMALNAANGQTAWTFSTAGRIWQTPVLQDNTLYFGDQSGQFYALQTSDQTLQWDRVRPGNGVIASPLVQAEQIIFVTDSGQIYAVSPAGEIRWARQIEGKEPAIYTPPILTSSGEIVIAPMNADALLVAYSPEGQLLWTFTSK